MPGGPRKTLPFVPGHGKTLLGKATKPLPPGDAERRESWRFERLVEHEESSFVFESEHSVVAGRYQIIDAIGAGGMGQVYRVRHRQLGKLFALKVMQASFSRDFACRQLFHREAQLASSLEHPNIVSVVDFGEDERHGLFMVMELIDGEGLSDRLEQHGPLPIKVVCDIAYQVADALACSHGQYVVHADIKPDNILCLRPSARTDRRNWAAKLVDFGMANLLSLDREDDGTLGGTPAYMAPERMAGQAPRPSMDIYGLGVVMYEMLTGQVPFSGNTLKEIFEEKEGRAPVPLSEVVEDRIPKRLEHLVDRAMAKRPEDRHPSIEAFIDELRGVMQLCGLRERRKTSASRRKLDGGLGVARRDRAAAVTFDDLPWPMAVVRKDGTVTLANPAFAYWVTGKATQPVEGKNVLDTKLPELCKSLRSDICRAIDHGARSSSIVTFDGDEAVTMQVSVRRHRSERGACLLALLPAESNSRSKL